MFLVEIWLGVSVIVNNVVQIEIAEGAAAVSTRCCGRHWHGGKKDLELQQIGHASPAYAASCRKRLRHCGRDLFFPKIKICMQHVRAVPVSAKHFSSFLNVSWHISRNKPSKIREPLIRVMLTSVQGREAMMIQQIRKHWLTATIPMPRNPKEWDYLL